MTGHPKTENLSRAHVDLATCAEVKALAAAPGGAGHD